MKPRAFFSLSLFTLIADSAKPWTYWYWLAGHVSAEGVGHLASKIHKLGRLPQIECQTIC